MNDHRLNVSSSHQFPAADALSSEVRYRRHRIVWDVRPQPGTSLWMGKAAVVSLGDGAIKTRIETGTANGSHRSGEGARKYLINAAKEWIDKRIAESKAPDADYGRIVVWNDSFSVGVRKIDKQHQELINIMNLLVENEDAGGNSETLASVLDRMTKYAHYHFETEETLMLEYHYPDYESHRDDHTDFKLKTAKFCLDAVQRKETLPDEVISYLRQWLTHHILRTDMKYKPYFLQRGLR
jgi:hemerythrin-like metal-binding protein